MQNRPDPAPLFRLGTAYWQSQALFAGLRLGLFGLLAQASEGLSAAEAARALGAHPRPTRLLLRALAGLGLVAREGDRYAATPLSRTFLTEGSPAFMGNALLYGADMYPAWAELAETVQSGRPALDQKLYLGADPERTRRFVHGMHNRALATGRALTELVELGPATAMLDVGGGPGTYAALFALKNPALTVTVLDLPEILAVAREIVASLGAAERVRFLPGDYHLTAFPEGVDAVLLSGVLHREDEEGCRALIAKAAACLKPGGRCIASDVFIAEEARDPAFAPLFGLNMALSAPSGGAHEEVALRAWMEESGLSAVTARPFPPPMPHTIITGVKS